MRTLLLFLAFALGGCHLFYSAPKPIESKPLYEPLPDALDREYFHAPTGDLLGRYPKDWLQVNTEEIPELENIIEVYTDVERSRAFVLTEIPGTAELRRRVERDGIAAVAEESLKMRMARIPTMIVTREPLARLDHNVLYSSYEYETRAIDGSTLRHRVACVGTGVRFYELALVELHAMSGRDALENFRLLQAVIAGLEGTASVGSSVSR
jgi:hypothetical protein